MPATAHGDRQSQALHEEEEDFYQDIELLQSHGINGNGFSGGKVIYLGRNYCSAELLPST